MILLQIIQYPRHCSISSHQFHLDGICLDIINGIALVESANGSVTAFNLTENYSIKFKDRR